jgi:hypothetical protein
VKRGRKAQLIYSLPAHNELWNSSTELVRIKGNTLLSINQLFKGKNSDDLLGYGW